MGRLFLHHARSALGVREGEGKRVALLFLFSVLAVGGLVITGSVVGRALFLSALPRSAIPLKFVLPPLTMVLVAARYASIALRVRTDRLIVTSALLLAAGLLCFRFGLATTVGSHLAFLCLMFVYFDVATNLTMIQFWTFAGELFDPREAKRLFGLISAGGTIAAVVFGATLRALSGHVQTSDFLFLMVACLLGVAVCTRRLGQLYGSRLAPPQAPSEEEKSSVVSSLKEISRSPLLVSLATLIVVVAAVTDLTDYQMDLALQSTYGEDGQAMMGFLGGFRFWTGVVAAAVQFLVAGRLFARFGIKAALLLLPLGMGLGSTAILLSAGMLWAVVLPRATDTVLKYTINQTAFNLLYLPVKPRLRRTAKVLISGMINPSVACVLGVSFMLVERYGQGISLVVWSVPVLLLVGFWVRTVLRATTQYVEALASSIRSRDLDPDQESVNFLDDTTITVVGETLKSSDPVQVVHAIDLMQRLPEVDWSPYLPDLFGHQSEDVRVQALELAASRDELNREVASKCLSDPSEKVRAAAVCALCKVDGAEAVEKVESCLQDPAPEVRAAVITGLIREGGLDGVLLAAEHLKALLVSSRVEERLAGAGVLGGLEAKSFHGSLEELMNDAESRVRVAAVRAAGRLAHRELIRPLLEKLDDPHTRTAAGRALSRCLGEDIPLLVPKLSHPETPEAVRIAIVKIFEAQRTEIAGQLLWGQLSLSGGLYRTAVVHTLLHLREKKVALAHHEAECEALLKEEAESAYELALYSQGEDLLALAVRKRLRQSLERLLALCSLLYPEISLNCLKASLFQSDKQVRAYAVELLDNVLEGEVRALLMPLFTTEPEELPEMAGQHREQPIPQRLEQLEKLAGSEDWWLRTCAYQTLRVEERTEHLELIRSGLQAKHPLERDTAWLAFQTFHSTRNFNRLKKDHPESLTGTPYLEALAAERRGKKPMPLSNIEELIFLRSVPLFAELSGEELAGIVPITQEVHFPSGTSFIKEGDEGDCLYVVVDGEVAVEIEGEQVSICASPDTLGELAILSDEPRTATCTARTDLVTLRLDKSDFWELMGERPEIAKGVIKVLLKYAQR